MSEEVELKLTGKQKAFVEAYLGEAHFNATKAAELAGYSGDSNTLSQRGFELVRNSKISELIEAGFKERAMGANEVITRLAEIARGKVTDVLDADGHFDLKAARQRNKDGLIKKLKTKRTLKQKKTEVREDMRSFLAEDEIEDIQSDVEIIYEEVEFELYSAHEALRDLGKHHKLFTEKIEHGGEVGLKHSVVRVPPKMSTDEWNKQQSEK